MLLTLLLSACQEEELARYNSSVSHHDSLDGKKSEEDVNVSCVYSWTCPELLIERRQPSTDRMAKGLHQLDLAARCVARHKSRSSSRENIHAYEMMSPVSLSGELSY